MTIAFVASLCLISLRTTIIEASNFRNTAVFQLFLSYSSSNIIGCRMTEDATSMEEWGPTTKTMAEISDASKNYDDYVRIVQVLRGR